MKQKELTRNQQILADYERLKRNGGHVARLYGLSRQRVHQIVLLESKKLKRKPKGYKLTGDKTVEDRSEKITEYQRYYHGVEE